MTGLAELRKLVSPFGLVSHTGRMPRTDGEPDLPVHTAIVGRIHHVLDLPEEFQHRPEMGNLDGAGGDIDQRHAADLAIAESLERYSSAAYDPRRVIWASATELGSEALDLAALPACSPAELAHPACGLVAPDQREPMRWVRGWSLTRQRSCYVPAVLVWMMTAPQSLGERFTHTVSTGCAVHTDPVSAVVNGLLEVIERDALALTWLQRLRLPRLLVEPDTLPEPHRAMVRRATLPHLRTVFFDATTDVGVPVVYAVQLADHDAELAQTVVAVCALDPAAAVAKLMREAASVRIALRVLIRLSDLDPTGERPSVFGGAALLAPRSARHHFDFLLDGGCPTRTLADLPAPGDAAPLPWLLERVHGAGGEVIVVDLTTDEAADVGATVVRVLVPQLMPLSFAHRARYLAHPRLYAAPARMGHPVHAEPDLNPTPQPFA